MLLEGTWVAGVHGRGGLVARRAGPAGFNPKPSASPHPRATPGKRSLARLASHMVGLETVQLSVTSSYGDAEFKQVGAVPGSWFWGATLACSEAGMQGPQGSLAASGGLARLAVRGAWSSAACCCCCRVPKGFLAPRTSRTLLALCRRTGPASHLSEVWHQGSQAGAPGPRQPRAQRKVPGAHHGAHDLWRPRRPVHAGRARRLLRRGAMVQRCLVLTVLRALHACAGFCLCWPGSMGKGQGDCSWARRPRRGSPRNHASPDPPPFPNAQVRGPLKASGGVDAPEACWEYFCEQVGLAVNGAGRLGLGGGRQIHPECLSTATRGPLSAIPHLQIRSNLHVVLSFSPVAPSFRTWCSHFAVLVAMPSMIWFHPWPESALCTGGVGGGEEGRGCRPAKVFEQGQSTTGWSPCPSRRKATASSVPQTHLHPWPPGLG